jgi:hypothetical protein
MSNYKDSNNNLYFLDDDSFVNLLPADCVAITPEKAEEIRIANIPAVPEPTYKELRAVAYPSIPAQLDMQYHDKLNLTTTWEDSITAVKVEFPKPVVVVEDLVIPIEVPLVEEVLNG